MVDHREVRALHGGDDRLDRAAGELLHHGGAEHAGQGLGHDHAVRAGLPQGLDVARDELRRLLHDQVHGLRLVHAGVEDLADVHQAPGERERADDPGQQRLVRDLRLFRRDGRKAHRDAPARKVRHGQGPCRVLIRHELAGDGGHLVRGKAHARAEGLGLDGQVHGADRRGRGQARGVEDGLGLQLRAAGHLVHRDAQRLCRGEGKDGQGALFPDARRLPEDLCGVHALPPHAQNCAATSAALAASGV